MDNRISASANRSTNASRSFLENWKPGCCPSAPTPDLFPGRGCSGVNAEEELKKQAEVVRLKDAPLEDQVWAQLKGVYDPEIPVDIVNLGLVYDCAINQIADKKVVQVKMTLTAPGCGMGPVIAADAQAKIMTVDGIDEANVELVWDPAWNQDMITEEGKMKLGMI